MTKNLFCVLFLIATAMIFAGCSKKTNIVSVDMDKVAKESEQAKKIIGETESFAKSLEEQMYKAGQQIQAASSDPRVSREQIEQMKAQFSQMYGEARTQVDQQMAKAEDEIHQRVQEAIKTVAPKKGWDIVLIKTRQSPVWTNDTLDRSEEIIKQMDRK